MLTQTGFIHAFVIPGGGASDVSTDNKKPRDGDRSGTRDVTGDTLRDTTVNADGDVSFADAPPELDRAQRTIKPPNRYGDWV